MSETAYKAVTSDLKSPFMSREPPTSPRAGLSIDYAIGGDFVAVNTGSHGIWAAPTIDIVLWLVRASFQRDPDVLSTLRYLELSYDVGDVLKIRHNGGLSLAAVHVVGEAFP